MYNETIENYLKAIYTIQGEMDKVATTTLAKRLAIAPASVTGMIKKLSEMNLITYEKYQGVKLTLAGQKIALEVIRHHRLIELFLAEALGVPWDKVHAEAEKWEHVLSEDIEERIDELLGFPTHDPHGSPIPDRNGEMPESSDILLSDMRPQQRGVIVEVCDRNPELLRYLGNMALYPKTNIMVLKIEPFEGPLTLDVDGTTHTLGRKVAQQIFVHILESDQKPNGVKNG